MSRGLLHFPLCLPLSLLSSGLVEPVVGNTICPKEKALWLTGASALSCPVAGFSPPQETGNLG